MKSKMMFLFVAAVSAALFSCSDDKEVKKKGDPDVTHEGEKWTITSVEYTLIDQGVSGSGVNQVYKEGTKANAGSFYFVSGQAKGSFEMNVEDYNKEDSFNYSINVDNGSISINKLEQSAGAQTNQNVVTLSGEAADTEMTLSGSIVKQSTTGQFMLELSMTLHKD